MSNTYSVQDVWAAAAAAQRINGGYFKGTTPPDAENGTAARLRNRDLMQELLDEPGRITEADRAAGESVCSFIRNDLTFRALKGRLTDFDQAASRCIAVEDQFDAAKHRYELAVIASLPASVARSQARDTAETRLRWAKGGLIGKIGDRITAQVEIVSAVFSQNYGCWFLRGVTDQDQAVMFSYRQGVDAGQWLTIRGAVKAHRDHGMTQLNRVKVL